MAPVAAIAWRDRTGGGIDQAGRERPLHACAGRRSAAKANRDARWTASRT